MHCPIKELRWRRRKEARPAELTAAALELFVEKGFAATRLDEVAARAGVSKGTLYLYFESKEDLFKAVIREGLLPLLAEGEELMASMPGPASELFKAIVMRWWEIVGEGPIGGIPKLIFAEARNFPEIARFYADEVIERGKRLFVAVFQRGIDSGEFRPFDPNTLVHLVISPLIMRVIWKHSLDCCGVTNVPIDAYLREYLEMTLRGLRSDVPSTQGSAG
jgi:AcrR family transcriptional regulator